MARGHAPEAVAEKPVFFLSERKDLFVEAAPALRPDRKIGSIGIPMPQNEVRIVIPFHRHASEDRVGKIAKNKLA